MGHADTAEDLTQEILLKAYRYYDDYEETGRLRAWLKTIARNTLRNYFASPQSITLLSLDAGEEDDESLYHILSDKSSPEDELIRRELIDRVMNLLAVLPSPQRTVLTYRYLDGLSVEQTAARMGIPQGSVKSKTHYALQKMRKDLGLAPTPAPPSTLKPQTVQLKLKKGEINMKCSECSNYLFQFAKGELPEAVKTEVQAHLDTCPSCRDAVTALKNLIPHLPAGREGEVTAYNITIPSLKRTFFSNGYNMPNAEKLNACLEANGGCVPEGECWMGGGSNLLLHPLAIFDNEGEKLEFEISEQSSGHYRYDVRKLRKIYTPVMWENTVFEDGDDYYFPKQSYEAPNLYTGRVNNLFGKDVHYGLYIAIPKEAVNVRIKRGSGVIDCGPYQFVYAQRYVIETESIWLEYSYNL